MAADNPDKYIDALLNFEQAEGSLSQAASGKVAQIARFLEWAIQEGEEGFEPNDGNTITVHLLADAVNCSKTTAGAAVQRLATQGLITRSDPKSPYDILRKEPLPLSEHLPWPEREGFIGVRSCQISTPERVSKLESALDISRETLLQPLRFATESLDIPARNNDPHLFLRVRSRLSEEDISAAKEVPVCSLEFTYLLDVQDTKRAMFLKRLKRLQGNISLQKSAYQLLRQSQIDVVCARSYVLTSDDRLKDIYDSRYLEPLIKDCLAYELGDVSTDIKNLGAKYDTGAIQKAMMMLGCYYCMYDHTLERAVALVAWFNLGYSGDDMTVFYPRQKTDPAS